MSSRKYIVAIATAAALFGLTACGDEIADTPAPPVATAPAPDTPALPLPTANLGDVIDRAYLAALHDRGIDLTREEALHAAEVSCRADGLFDATRAVQRVTGLSQGDAAYLVGAALMTCDGGGLQ